MIDVTKVADISAFMGSSGSGKSAGIKQELAAKRVSRLLVFDPEGEYETGQMITSMKEFHARVMAARSGPVSLVFKPSTDDATARAQFDAFCQIAYAAGNLTMVCEELAFVTEPNRAPQGWALCTLRGRKHGLSIYGASQRPASVDKNFFSNATRVRCGRLNYDADIKTMANVLGVSGDDIRALLPLHYIERDMRSGIAKPGEITFGAKNNKKGGKMKKDS